MEPLEHHSKTKKQIKDALAFHLYNTLGTHFKDRLDQIIHKNSIELKSPHLCFTYKGKTYTYKGQKTSLRALDLSPKLHREMDEYLEDMKNLQEGEVNIVNAFIDTLLNLTDSLQGYLLIFPKGLHPPIQKLIDSCPCRTKSLTEEDIKRIEDNGSSFVELINQRLFINQFL